jgi:hypothetical protein
VPAGTRTATPPRPRALDLRRAIGNRALGRLLQRELLAAEIIRDIGPVKDPKE